MSYQDFLTSYARFKKVSVDEIVAQGKKNRSIRYALSNRDRGAIYIERIQKLYTRPIKGLTVLDLGCAFGGTCIELAKAGATSVGVDVIPSYVRLAKENAKSEVNSEFFICDFTDKKILEHLSAYKFDVFIINHVLEHIYDTVSLLENVTALATKDACIIFDLPNGQSIQSVRAEGHTGYFAASLAPPDCWYLYKESRARIYYRKWAYFAALLDQAGFKSVIRATPAAPADRKAALMAFIDEIETKRSTVPEKQKALTDEVIAQYIEEIHYDLINLSPADLDQKYFAYFWKGVAATRAELIPENTRKHLDAADWGD
jgi:2-polyprenyl-3-methyl-5-hydroxy-6-metoxy-1,4-benzoquinol methylase